MRKYEFFEHTADMKFRAFGRTLNQAFENSALAMFHIMSQNKIKSKIKKRIKVKGNDLENLLYNFLEKLLVLLDSEDFFLAKSKIKIDRRDMILTAELFGDSVKNYETIIDVKAVTYNQMFVKKEKKFWVCQVVLDV